ncbi:hypothetical protein [Microlunatus speluncae]|uniref:hypothetical protein n=1 Tax=Microlunatus speluncae TaxID=2594267 RepID=UPI00126640D4|nr:hypothetical protein [Microlunatus speluncae]
MAGSPTSVRTTMIMAAAALLLSGCTGLADPDPPDPTPNGTASAPAESGSPSARAAKPYDEDRQWGRHRWSDGLELAVVDWQDCVPSGNAQPKDVERAVVITVRASNGGTKPYEPDDQQLSIGAMVDGRPAVEVNDRGGPCSSNLYDFGGLDPQEEKDLTISFAVPEAGGALLLEFRPILDGEAYTGRIDL